MLRLLPSLFLALIALAGPLLSPTLIATEDIFDRLLQPLRDRLSAPRVIIVELMDGASQWPLRRSQIVDLAANALNSGAISVGVDVVMSHPSSEAEDAALRTFLLGNSQVVPLTPIGTGEVLLEFGARLDPEGRFVGVKCDTAGRPESDAFAIRLAVASGVDRSTLQSACRNSLLRPYISRNEAVSTIPAVDLFQGRSAAQLRRKVVILGTANAQVGALTYNGIQAQAVIDQGVVESALRQSWRMPNPWLSATVYLALLVYVLLSPRFLHSNVHRVSVGVVTLLLVLMARIWIWLPVWPAVAIIGLGLLHPTSQRTSGPTPDVKPV